MAREQVVCYKPDHFFDMRVLEESRDREGKKRGRDQPSTNKPRFPDSYDEHDRIQVSISNLGGT